MVIDFITRYSSHTYFSPFSISWYRQLWAGCIIRNGEWHIFVNYSVFSALFSLKLRILFEESILGTLVQKDAVPPMVISNHHRWKPYSTKTDLCMSYLCLRLTKVLFETSLKSFQYNTKDRRLSNYLIKLILCSHCRSRYKGLFQNKKHGFDQYTKGGHFCAAHMALNEMCSWNTMPPAATKSENAILA